MLDATERQIQDFGPTFFEKVDEKERQNIVPFGSVPFVPDVTGLTQKESDAALAKAKKENQEAADKATPPTKEQLAARQKADSKQHEADKEAKIEAKRLESEKHH